MSNLMIELEQQRRPLDLIRVPTGHMKILQGGWIDEIILEKKRRRKYTHTLDIFCEKGVKRVN